MRGLLALVLTLATLGCSGSGSSEKCTLHGERLRGDTVPWHYGITGDPIPYDVRQRLFPFARTERFGGCVVGPDSPMAEKVLFCPTCRRTRELWLKSQNAPPDRR